MNINFKKLKTYRPEIKLVESGTTIGSIVRWQRKQKNMTLNEGADGICSISYLSKLENNLIEPSNQILDDLKKRFELEDLLDFDLKRYGEHYNDIISKFFNHKPIPSLYFKIYDMKNDYKSKLILFSYHIDRRNVQKSKLIYKELEFEINKFTHDEINLFYYLTAEMLKIEGKYFIALKILNLTNVIDKNSKLSMLIDYSKIYLSLKLGRHLQSQFLFSDLAKKLLRINNLEKYHNLLKLKLYYSVNEYDYDFSNDLINESSFLTKKEKQLTKTFLTLLQKKAVSETLLEKNISESDHWYLNSLIHFDRNEDYQKIKEIMTNSTKYKSNPINEQIEFFLESKYTLDNDAFTRYIKNITSDFENNFNGCYILSLLFDNAADYYENKTFYKTANLIRKHGKEMIFNLKRMT